MSGAFQIGPDQLNAIRLLPASPLEELLHVLRTSASAQPSPVMSEVEELGQGTGPWAAGYADIHVARGAAGQPEDLHHVDARRPESTDDMPESGPDPHVIGEQDEDTEHTTDAADEQWRMREASQGEQPGLASDSEEELEQVFGPREGYNEEVIRRMNVLATVLRSEHADITERLEETLQSFRDEEIRPDDFAQVTLQDPLLLLLAQHRSFRICRKEIFCPAEDCPSTRKIGTIQKLTTHLQIEHNVQKEETTDMLQYFVAQMLPEAVRPVLTKVLANGESQETKRRWDGIHCHYPGCSYLHWKYDQVREYVNRQHKDLSLEIRSLG
jgi:hypothetical protein